MKDMIKLAAKAAKIHKRDKRLYQMGAVAIRADGVIVCSSNGASQDVDPSMHAEARVLRKAGFGASLFVARVRKLDGTTAMAKPCPACEALIRNRGVKVVCYSTDNGGYETIRIAS